MSTDTPDAAFVPALNFHVWQPCNMACRYCFAEFADSVPDLQRDKSQLRDRAFAVVDAAALAGVQKLTLVGGEPTLCPWFGDLLQRAKSSGMVTMLVTNGVKISREWVAQHGPLLNWVALSVDSLSPETNRKIGRAVGGRVVPDERYYLDRFDLLVSSGIRIKVNTVVSAANWQEDFLSFLRKVRPERWKVLQALHIAGENDKAFPAMAVTAQQFQQFVGRHRAIDTELMLAAEDNDAMKGSYLMVDPMGRFVTNDIGRYRYSPPIWQVGWAAARAEASVDISKFEARGGIYGW